jgi:hypothetical protein
MGRILLFVAAALLATTALIHAMGQPMVDDWIHELGEKQKAAICLVWITDSVSWALVSAIWVMAGWKHRRDHPGRDVRRHHGDRAAILRRVDAAGECRSGGGGDRAFSPTAETVRAPTETGAPPVRLFT